MTAAAADKNDRSDHPEIIGQKNNLEVKSG